MHKAIAPTNNTNTQPLTVSFIQYTELQIYTSKYHQYSQNRQNKLKLEIARSLLIYYITKPLNDGQLITIVTQNCTIQSFHLTFIDTIWVLFFVKKDCIVLCLKLSNNR
jgi:hypothetical protein